MANHIVFVTIFIVIEQILAISIMGAPIVQWGNQPLHIQRKIPRAILYYLAGHNEPISRADLCLLLWQDKAEAESRRFLRENLSKLRKALPNPDAIKVEHDLISLDVSKTRVDLLEFQSLLNSSRHNASLVPRNEPLPFETYQNLSRAVKLWRGPRLLAGFVWPESEIFDSWITETNQMVEINRQFCILRLADHATASGNPNDALHWLHLAAAQDPFNSDLQYRILTTLMETGRQGEVSNYCNYLRNLYGEEDSLPASLSGLCDRLQAPVKSQPVSRVQWLPTSTLKVPMIGRSDELRRLQAASNRGGTATVLGEPGAGKTRLTYEFFHQNQSSPRLMLMDCQENERSLPFQALITSLRQCVHPDEWQHLGVPWRGQMSTLLPELAALFPELHNLPRLAEDDARPQILEAFYQFMDQLAKNHHILFILEDAQWCDGASLSALKYLLSRDFFRPPNFLIINSRTASLDQDLLDFLDQPLQGVPHEKIPLSLLELDDIREISRSVLGENLPEENLDRLTRDTGGNPLYVIEWLRSHLFHRSDLTNGGRIESPTMSSLLNLMRDRLNTLNPVSRQVLAAAAILGNQFTPSQVEVVAALPVNQVTEALEELEESNLIRPMDGKAVYSFIHDKIREVLIMDLSLARQRMLHLRTARMYQTESVGEETSYAARIAAHFEAGGEPIPAIYAWVNAALYALHLFSRPEAEEAFQRAEKLVKSYELNLPDDVIYHLYRTWGFIAQESTRPADAIQIFSALLHFGEVRRSRLMMGVAQTGIAGYHLQIGQVEASLEAANKAVIFLETLPNIQERVDAFKIRSNVFTTQAKNDLARRDLEAAIALSENSTDHKVIRSRSLIKAILAWVYTYSGWPERAVEVARQAQLDAQRIYSSYAESSALISLATATFYSFNYQEADQLIDEGLRISEPLHYWHNIGYFHTIRAFITIARGEIDACWKELQTINEIANAHNCPDLITSVWLIRGQIHRFLWNFPAALECNRQGEITALDIHLRLENIAQQATVLATSGQIEASASLYDQVLSQSQKLGLGLVYYPALAARFGALALYWPVEQMLAESDSVIRELVNCEIPDVHEFTKYGLTILHLRTGNLEEALRHSESFNQFSMSTQTPWLKIINMVLQKIVCGATGQPLPETVRQSVIATLEHLDAHTQHPDLRAEFEVYRKFLLEQIP